MHAFLSTRTRAVSSTGQPVAILTFCGRIGFFRKFRERGQQFVDAEPTSAWRARTALARTRADQHGQSTETAISRGAIVPRAVAEPILFGTDARIALVASRAAVPKNVRLVARGVFGVIVVSVRCPSLAGFVRANAVQGRHIVSRESPFVPVPTRWCPCRNGTYPPSTWRPNYRRHSRGRRSGG